MPSRDPKTGKRLSGGAQRKKSGTPRAQSKGTPPPAVEGARQPSSGTPNPYLGTPPPPTENTALVEAWAARLGTRAVEAAARGDDPARTKFLVSGIRRLGQLKDKARHSFKAVQVLAEFEGVQIDLLADRCPDNPVATVAWAYFRLALALQEAALSQDDFDDLAVQERWRLKLDALATLGFVPQVQAIRELTARHREGAAGAGARAR